MTSPLGDILAGCLRAARSARAPEPVGRVVRVAGPLLESIGPVASVGELCLIGRAGEEPELAEVVGFQGPRLLLMTFGRTQGFHAGAPVWATGEELHVPVGGGLLGRVVDALGRPLDDLGPLRGTESAPLDALAPHPLQRAPIVEALGTGVRALDAFLTLGRGQRMGIFAGSGVGKSVLLGDIARFTEADVAVVALVGERGREVGEFLRRDLGSEGLERSVVVVATAEQPPLLRVKAAFTATRMAEAFREEGRHVLLLMDSLTRVAMAQREIGLTRGEPPTTRGYTPSVFSLLPQLLERAGSDRRGSVTGLYTVLVEGDDLNDPIADSARSVLDGHVVLSRKLANKGHFPAVDVLASISRLASQIGSPAELDAQRRARGWLAAYADAEDLIQLGAYVRGGDRLVDEAIDRMPALRDFLRQPAGVGTTRAETLRTLLSIAGTAPEITSGVEARTDAGTTVGVGTAGTAGSRAATKAGTMDGVTAGAAAQGGGDAQVSLRPRGTGTGPSSGSPRGGDPARGAAPGGTGGAPRAGAGAGHPLPLGRGTAGGGRPGALSLGTAPGVAAAGDRTTRG